MKSTMESIDLLALAHRLDKYTQNFVAYKLDGDFAAAVQEAIDVLFEMAKEAEK